MTFAPKYSIGFTCPATAADAFEAVFENEALAISAFEAPDDASMVDIDVLVAASPDVTAVAAGLKAVAEAHGCDVPEPVIRTLEDQDWLQTSAKAFQPITAGAFCIHSAQFEGKVPHARHHLLIEAATAFGTGEHATTFACLLAFSDLLKRQNSDQRPVLDMGAGSGILAIAAAKAFQEPVVAVDIDPESVRVTQRHARANHVPGLITAFQSDGFKNRRIRAGGPYGLIFANILAGPLCDMAHPIAQALKPGGRAVLSGLLNSQEGQVLSAMRRSHLVLERRYRINGWSALVVRR